MPHWLIHIFAFTAMWMLLDAVYQRHYHVWSVRGFVMIIGLVAFSLVFSVWP